MKTFKYLTIFVVSVFFIAGLTATSWSGPSKPGPAPVTGKMGPKPGTEKIVPTLGTEKDTTAKPIYRCPNGWHLTEGSFKPDNDTTCVPNMPKSINCPKGTKPLFGDCEVGCIALPK